MAGKGGKEMVLCHIVARSASKQPLGDRSAIRSNCVLGIERPEVIKLF